MIWEGLGRHFSMKFGSHRENVDFVKIIVFLKENCYFSRSGLPKIEKNHEQIVAKSDVKNDPPKVTPQARTNQFLEPLWPPKTLVFSRFWQ